MRIKIDKYEIEIKAKDTYNNRFNKNDTMYFLNFLSSAFFEASKNHKSEGLEALAERNYNCSNNIYNFLDSLGFYDDIKNN